jgi:hypothetical protein
MLKWMWISLLIVLYFGGLWWTLLAGVIVWFVLIPLLSLWIAVHKLGDEEKNENE